MARMFEKKFQHKAIMTMTEYRTLREFVYGLYSLRNKPMVFDERPRNVRREDFIAAYNTFAFQLILTRQALRDLWREIRRPFVRVLGWWERR